MDLDSLNLPVKLTRVITDGLGTVGIDLPLFLTQAFLLVLCVAALVFGVRRMRRVGAGDLLGLLVVTGFGLFVAGVGYAWAQSLFAPVAGQLRGRIDLVGQADRSAYTGLRVALLNSRGQSVAREAGIVDSRNGFFVLSYDPEFGDHPRTLRISRPGCAELDLPLQRRSLRSAAVRSFSYRCAAQN